MKKTRTFGMLLAALISTLAASTDKPWPIAIQATGDEVKLSLELPAGKVTASSGEIKHLGNGVVQFHSRSGRLTIPLAQGEAIYGLTARLTTDYVGDERKTAAIGGLDRRGEKVLMWVVPTFSVYSPFYISSRGYGMFITGTFPGSYDIGATKPDELNIEWETDPAKGLTAYFFFGPYDQILDQYTALIGRPFFPPKWAYTPWRWRDEHRIGIPTDLDGVKVNAQLAEDILMYERLDIPAGVYLIDRPYGEGRLGFARLVFNPLRFPNAEKMSEVLHKRGYKLVTWGAPWAIGNGPHDLGIEAKKLGYIVPGSKENLDYTNPAAVAWHEEKLAEFVRRYNIDGWKLDRGEEDIPDKTSEIWHDGRTGREMRNAYPWLYIKTYYDVMARLKGRDFVLLPRPGYAGTQTLSTNWGGDIPGTEAGLRMAIIGVQRTAFMGFPNWGTDTGGYREFKDREVFARWLEFSCLSPIMEVGGVGNHAPWNMPTKPRYDEEMIAIYRRCHKLRMALLDYIYEQAVKASATGAPIVRPLVFSYPDDPKVRNLWDEYLFGPDLLAAPIWQSGVREREVYLPAGQWINFWDRSQSFTGPATITAPAPLDRIPLFIRKKSEQKFAGMEEL